jgi:hypothetical protein
MVTRGLGSALARGTLPCCKQKGDITLRRFTNLLVAGTLVASGLGAVIAAGAQPASASTVVETCKKASGTATLNPGIPIAKKKDTGGSVAGDGVTVTSPAAIFTPGADNPASKLKAVIGSTPAWNAGTAFTVNSTTQATLSSPVTPGPVTLKLTRNWTSTVTSSASTVKKCSGTIGTGLATDTAVTTLVPVTTQVPGNCTSLAAPTNGVTQFQGNYHTDYKNNGTTVGSVDGVLTAKSNGQVAQEALTSTITAASGAASSFMGGTTTLTITFTPTTGDCVSTNVTAVSIASVIGTAGKAITSV